MKGLGKRGLRQRYHAPAGSATQWKLARRDDKWLAEQRESYEMAVPDALLLSLCVCTCCMPGVVPYPWACTHCIPLRERIAPIRRLSAVCHKNPCPMPDQALSMGVHESQSLLWERMVALSRPFAAYLAPKLKAAFPQLPDLQASTTGPASSPATCQQLLYRKS